MTSCQCDSPQPPVLDPVGCDRQFMPPRLGQKFNTLMQQLKSFRLDLPGWDLVKPAVPPSTADLVTCGTSSVASVQLRGYASFNADMVIRVRGIVEFAGYIAGSPPQQSQGYVCIPSSAAGGVIVQNNLWSLTISGTGGSPGPMFNGVPIAGSSLVIGLQQVPQKFGLLQIDEAFLLTSVPENSLLTLSVTNTTGQEYASDQICIPNLSPYPRPFYGQFLQLDAVSIIPTVP